MKVLFLYSEGGEIITGGQKYEDNLYKVLQNSPSYTTERIWLNNTGTKVKKYLSPLKNLLLIKKLRKYDLIMFNSVSGLNFIPLAVTLRYALKKKTAVIHHHFLYREKSGIKRIWYKLLEKGFLRSAGTIIVPSPYINELCHGMFPGKNIRYWQIPFDPRPTGEQPAPRQGNLLYIGTIERRKGLVYLLDALIELKRRHIPVSLKIVGKAVQRDYFDQLKDTISREKLNVEFTGFISQERKDEIMAETDVFVFPSLMEGYGMVLCESMVNGVPVICFNNSAMPYTIKNEINGLLIPDRDAKEFANAIERLTTDRELRERLSEGSRATAAGLVTPQKFNILVKEEVDDMLGLSGRNDIRNQPGS